MVSEKQSMKIAVHEAQECPEIYPRYLSEDNGVEGNRDRVFPYSILVTLDPVD